MSEVHDTPTAAHSRVEARPNGQASLSDRVRSLRLKTGGPGARPRSAWLPWGLTIIALATAGLFGWRAYHLAPADVPPAAEQGANSGDAKASPATSTAAAPTTATG